MSKLNRTRYTLGYAVNHLFNDGIQYHFYMGKHKYQHIGTMIDKDSLSHNQLEVVYNADSMKYEVFNVNKNYDKQITLIPF